MIEGGQEETLILNNTETQVWHWFVSISHHSVPLSPDLLKLMS